MPELHRRAPGRAGHVRPAPVRGAAVRSLDLPLPPRRMPLLRRGRPLKRWRYLGVYAPELMLCVGDARIAGLAQRWWAVALPDGSLFEGAGRGPIELAVDEGPGVEVVSAHGRSYIWTRKQAAVPVRARVDVGGRSLAVDGPFGFVDDSAGYHARHTTWRWSAGIGRAVGGAAVAWNLVEGVHDAPEASERTVWIDGDPHEVGPQPFAKDLSRVGDLRFEQWCVREDHTNRLLVRSDYRQPFGSFSGRLPGGVELESGYGVMEWHDVFW
jgi:Protein of unknown function (DUF2804)